jgi:hypothetical protein
MPTWFLAPIAGLKLSTLVGGEEEKRSTRKTGFPNEGNELTMEEWRNRRKRIWNTNDKGEKKIKK